MDVLEKIKQEAQVIKSAPFSFVLFLTLGLVGGYTASSWYYCKQITDEDQQNKRYRVALGIDRGGPNALAELTNSELQAKALGLASKVRELCISFRKREENLPIASDPKTAKDNHDRYNALMREVSQEFDHDVKSDFLNANNEVLRRLDRKAVASVVRGPIFTDAETGTPIGMTSLTPGKWKHRFFVSTRTS
jgi:hypothetical protein